MGVRWHDHVTLDISDSSDVTPHIIKAVLKKAALREPLHGHFQPDINQINESQVIVKILASISTIHSLF